MRQPISQPKYTFWDCNSAYLIMFFLVFQWQIMILYDVKYELVSQERERMC